jgi:hypothetical protein
MKIDSIIAILFLLSAQSSFAGEVDCSEAYGKPAKCEKIACDEKYREFIGRWEGPFLSFDDKLSLYDQNPNDGVAVEEIHVFRPYFNSVTYSPKDCLRNIGNSETFIIGRRIDTYPDFSSINFNTGKLEFTKGYAKPMALLVTGKKSDGTPFLRTADTDFGVIEYRRLEVNEKLNLSVWESVGLSWGILTVIDGQDFSSSSVHKRNVTVRMKMGSWEGVIGKGYHSRIGE